uniref:Uncharacterized protein n=1 Tax=Cacopsylla melanoneura TaxID=428564 RepID=A0A8D8ZR74_9HEMI
MVHGELVYCIQKIGKLLLINIIFTIRKHIDINADLLFFSEDANNFLSLGAKMCCTDDMGRCRIATLCDKVCKYTSTKLRILGKQIFLEYTASDSLNILFDTFLCQNLGK